VATGEDADHYLLKNVLFSDDGLGDLMDDTFGCVLDMLQFHLDLLVVSFEELNAVSQPFLESFLGNRVSKGAKGKKGRDLAVVCPLL